MLDTNQWIDHFQPISDEKRVDVQLLASGHRILSNNIKYSQQFKHFSPYSTFNLRKKAPNSFAERYLLCFYTPFLIFF